MTPHCLAGAMHGRAVSGWISARALPPDEKTAVPEDYRKWTHVRSTVIGPKSPIFGPEGSLMK